MEKIDKIVSTYKAADGTVFDNERDCLEHEKYLEFDKERFEYLNVKMTSLFQTINANTSIINIRMASRNTINYYIDGKKEKLYTLRNIISIEEYDEFMKQIYIFFGIIIYSGERWLYFTNR